MNDSLSNLSVPDHSRGLTAMGASPYGVLAPSTDIQIHDDLASDPAGGGAQTIQLRRLHQYMRGYYWLAIVLLTICGAAGAAVGFKCGKKMYASVGEIEILPVVPKVIYSVEDKGAIPMFDNFVESQAAIMQSQRVLDKAMDDSEWQSLGRGKTDRSMEDYAAEISVSHDGGILRIQALDPDPNAAMIDVKTLIGAYLKIYDERDQSSGERRMNLLEQRKDELSRELSLRHDSILEIAKAYHTDDLESQVAFQEERSNNLVKLIDEKRRLQAAVARKSSTTRPGVMYSDEQLASISLTFANLLQARGEYARKLELDSAKGLGLKNIEVKDTLELQNINDRDIEQARVDLQQKYANGSISNGVVENEQQLDEELKGLEEERDSIEAKLASMGTNMLSIKKLRGEVNEMQAERDEIGHRIEQLTLENQITERLQVLSYGDRPLSASRDTRITYSAAGGFGGGIFGFCVVAAFAFMDRRLRSPDQTEGGLMSAPMLGMLPRLPEDLSDPAQAILAAHCVHEIRTLLQIWSRRSRHRVFAITSPNPGAGKTSLTLALGASYATANLRTLIVDCDLVAGGLTRRAELMIKRMLGQIFVRGGMITETQLAEALRLATESGKKIGEVLLDQGLITQNDLDSAIASQIEQPIGILDAMHGVPIEQCIAPTTIPNLQILPVGAGTARDVPLLSPEALHLLIESLGKQFDVVLVDTGPTLGSLEASLVAGIVDGVVLVIRKGDRRPAFERAMSQLVTVGARVAGVVFNGATSDDIATFGRVNSSVRSRNDGVNGDGMNSSAPRATAPRSYGPLTSAVANFAPAAHRNSAKS